MDSVTEKDIKDAVSQWQSIPLAQLDKAVMNTHCYNWLPKFRLCYQYHVALTHKRSTENVMISPSELDRCDTVYICILYVYVSKYICAYVYIYIYVCMCEEGWQMSWTSVCRLVDRGIRTHGFELWACCRFFNVFFLNERLFTRSISYKSMIELVFNAKQLWSLVCGLLSWSIY